MNKLPRELVLVLKTNDCIRSIDQTLGGKFANLLCILNLCFINIFSWSKRLYFLKSLITGFLNILEINLKDMN